jgi:hypothetical protein
MSHASYYVKLNNGPLQVISSTDRDDALRSTCRVLTLHQRLTAGEHEASVKLATADRWEHCTITTDAAGLVTPGLWRVAAVPESRIPDDGALPVEVFSV